MKHLILASARLLAAAAPAHAVPASAIVVAADTCTLLRHGRTFKDAVNVAIKTNASSYLPDYRTYGKALSSFTFDQMLTQCPEEMRRLRKEQI